jgi:two-component system, OmpR family, sensor kinase
MSLRLRLTLVYTALLGVVILILGSVVYSAVSIVLLDHVDDTLERAVSEVTDKARLGTQGDLVVDLPALHISNFVLVQIWNRDRQLIISSQYFGNSATSIDPQDLQLGNPIYRNVEQDQSPLRVLTVPLVISGDDRSAGWIQVGVDLSSLRTTQNVLLMVLAIGAVIAMGLAAVVGWLVFERALAPLETVTEAATQIARADDLSRRIPYSGSANDEVGQLIQAFNLTLGRLEQLFTAQRRFMADVSHELRTPLTVIKGNVGLMRHISMLDDESLESIEGEVDRLTRMVGDLLLLAQAESGKIPLDMQPVELDTILLDVFQQMRVLAGNRVQIQFVDIDQVIVTGDRDRLKQVFLNLGGNAINYTQAGGQIQFGLYRVGNQARIVVSDNGLGIPPEDLPHIFERFYRGEKSRTRGRDGTGFGLGLSIAYWIVKNHGGRIEVDSKLNQGTTFCVWLPLEK